MFPPKAKLFLQTSAPEKPKLATHHARLDDEA
jgi:hypothetical protein